MTRKRVLVFTETALALSETFIADHCRALQRYEARLVALYKSGEHHADVARQVLFGAEPPGRMVRLAFRLGLSRRLDRIIAEIQPDILHAHYLTNGAFLLPYAERHGVPLVVTAHGHDAVRRLRTHSVYDQVYGLQRQRLARSKALVLPVSNHLRGKLADLGFDPQHLITHYLGIPITQTPLVDVAASPPVIVFVGRLVPKKGVDILLDAFAIVRSQLPAAELHIVGDGPLRELVLARTKQVEGIIMHGPQAPARTRMIISRGRVLTLPSRPASDGDEEGLGLVLLEAQAQGVPVVTAKAGATGEAVVNGETGFAVDPTNKDDLARALLAFLQDPNLAQSFGSKAYAFARQRFDIVQQTAKLERIYDGLLINAVGIT